MRRAQAFDGAAGEVGGAEAVELEAGVFEHGAAHVNQEAGFKFGVDLVLGAGGGGEPAFPGVNTVLVTLGFVSG